MDPRDRKKTSLEQFESDMRDSLVPPGLGSSTDEAEDDDGFSSPDPSNNDYDDGDDD